MGCKWASYGAHYYILTNKWEENKMSEKKTMLLTEINDNNIIDIDETICNDPEVESAIIEYQKGKILENEGKKLVNHAKEIFDRKLYKRHIKSTSTSSVRLSYTEYTKTMFDSKLFQELNPSLYKKFEKINAQKRYNIEQIINIDI